LICAPHGEIELVRERVLRGTTPFSKGNEFISRHSFFAGIQQTKTGSLNWALVRLSRHQ
jgi:hypothetical protein